MKRAKLNIYDPQVMPKIIERDLNLKESIEFDSSSELGEWKFASSIYESAIDSDALIFLTEWDEFKFINWKKNLRKDERSKMDF